MTTPAGYLSYLARRYRECSTPLPPGDDMAAERFTIRPATKRTQCLCRGAGKHCKNPSSVDTRRQRETQQAATPKPTATS